MKSNFFSVKVGTPDNFLLGICRINDLESNDYVYNTIGFGILFFSIWKVFDIRKKI